ncbi:EAL domain-containing protein [Nitratireductor sp. GISD-1A_MAKvit]|uniref:EAL domain-containing protein n=1 Tax=Nitratireductor sp. GISD-1A_MAKvit TaxID=3234198 RepID=UPI0034678214
MRKVVSVPRERAIHADEIGLETAKFGAYRLKSLFQPIFRIGATDLVPEAADAMVLPLLEYEPVGLEGVFSTLEPHMRGELNSLCNLMHIGNHHHLGSGDLPLHMSFEPALQSGSRGVENLALMFARSAQTGMALPSLVCSLSCGGESGHPVSNEVVETMRLGGVRIAVAEFGPSSSMLETIDRIQPDIVKFDARWFQRVAKSIPALRLMRQLVEGLKRAGAEVMVTGLESRAQLLAAMSVGADLVHGDVLARPQQAGLSFDMRPLEIRRIFRDPRKVVISLK